MLHLLGLVKSLADYLPIDKRLDFIEIIEFKKIMKKKDLAGFLGSLDSRCKELRETICIKEGEIKCRTDLELRWRVRIGETEKEGAYDFQPFSDAGEGERYIIKGVKTDIFLYGVLD